MTAAAAAGAAGAGAAAHGCAGHCCFQIRASANPAHSLWVFDARSTCAHASLRSSKSSAVHQAALATATTAALALLCGQPVNAEAEGQPQAPDQPLTNHPFDLAPVTNEHTAQMTMARAAALEYYQAGKYDKAEAKFKEALAEAIAGFEPQDPHIASAKNTLAEFYRNTRQYSKAEPLYREALEHLDALYGEKHWLYVSTKHNLALMYDADGQYQRAAKEMTQVLDLRLKLFGPRSFLYADSMYALAQITRKLGLKGSEEEAVKLMKDAVAILEDAESVQVNVIVYWLEDLAAVLRRQGKAGEAAGYLQKAIKYLASNKGEVMAQASALSDLLTDCLLEASQAPAARDVADACVAARTLLFKKDLAVVAAMLKLATIEGDLKRHSALQHAGNAAALSEEIQQDLSCTPAWGWWRKPQTARQGVRLVQAGHLLGASLKLQAFLHQRLPEGGKGEAAEAALQRAVTALQVASEHAQQQLQQQFSSPATDAPQDSGTVDELSSLLVDVMLLRIDCLDQLAQLLKQRGDNQAAQQAQQQAEQVAAMLVELKE